MNVAAPAVFAARIRFRRGALIVESERQGQTVHLIRSGRVRVFLLAESGQETTTAVLGPGQILGLGPLLRLPFYHAFAEALTDLETWCMPAGELLARLPGDRELLQTIISALGRRLALLEGLLRDVTLLPVADRIPDVLPRLQACVGDQDVGLTQAALAGLVGAWPESVSRSRSAQPRVEPTGLDGRHPARHGAASRVAGRTWHPPPADLAREGTGQARTVNLFEGLGSDEVDHLLAHLEVCRVERGEPVASSGTTPSEQPFLVQRGHVQLSLNGQDSRQIAAGIASRGDLFGVQPLFGLRPTGLEAHALVDSVLRTADGPTFLRTLLQAPRVAVNLMAQFGTRVVRAEHRLQCLAGADARTRLAAVLLEMAQAPRTDGAAPTTPGRARARRGTLALAPGVTHAMLATQIGATRETVTRLLRVLEDEGYIRRQGRRIEVRNPERLRVDFSLVDVA